MFIIFNKNNINLKLLQFHNEMRLLLIQNSNVSYNNFLNILINMIALSINE